MTTTQKEQLYKTTGDTEVSLEEYREFMFAKLRKHGNAIIHPEAIIGFRVGNHLDFKPYDKLGFVHPKSTEYYDKTRQDPQFMEIFEGIKASGQLDDPIMVYCYDKSDTERFILCVDGATRLSIVGYLRGENPDAFRRVPVMLFRGNYEEARACMVRRNLEGRIRPLTGYETMMSFVRFQSWGWSDKDIAERIGKNPATYAPQVKAILDASKRLVPSLQTAMKEGLISLYTAVQASAVNNEKQAELARKLKDGEKIHGRQINRENPKRNIRIAPRLEAFQKTLSEIEGNLKEKRKFSAVEKEFRALEDAIVYFHSAVEKALGVEPAKE